MRWLLFAMALASSCAFATEVEVTGYGTTVQEAVIDAKAAAIDQVSGSFVAGQTSLQDGRYRSSITQYHGGLIKRDKILSIAHRDGLVAVRLRADVDPDRVNDVGIFNGARIPPAVAMQMQHALERRDQLRRVVAALDDPAQAFTVKIEKIACHNMGTKTELVALFSVRYSPKWFDEVHALAKAAGQPVDMGSLWANAVWGAAALTAAINPSLPGFLFTAARHLNQHKKSAPPDYMLCFDRNGEDDVHECYGFDARFMRITERSHIDLEARIIQDGQVYDLGTFAVNPEESLYMNVWPGRDVYFPGSATERRFDSPGAVLFRLGSARYILQVPLSTTFIAKGGQLEFVVEKHPL